MILVVYLGHGVLLIPLIYEMACGAYQLWCTLVGLLSDNPIKTQPIYDLRQTKATVR